MLNFFLGVVPFFISLRFDLFGVYNRGAGSLEGCGVRVVSVCLVVSLVFGVFLPAGVCLALSGVDKRERVLRAPSLFD